jgi:hypothetical protein
LTCAKIRNTVLNIVAILLTLTAAFSYINHRYRSGHDHRRHGDRTGVSLAVIAVSITADRISAGGASRVARPGSLV